MFRRSDDKPVDAEFCVTQEYLPRRSRSDGESSSFRTSDDAIARLFTESHGDNWRYVAAWGKWLKWDGTRWAEDATLEVRHLVRLLCRDVANLCDKPGHAKDAASAKTINAVERLAKADRRHAATMDQWDRDPWLLNTSVGVIDLRSGIQRRHYREDYITKITNIAPGGDCPHWRAFLHRITNGDRELELFLQRVAGYVLSGVTYEHALFFLYGKGGNGKSTFVQTLAAVLGDYHRTAPMDLFLASRSDRHPTELAGLRGARLVTATETQEGRRWDEAKIKSITGGDRIAARFMRQDYFEFIPTFKILVSGNHRPSIRNVDEAMRRRLHLVPFVVTIPKDEQDDQLMEKLEVELPSILAWAIEGASEWGMMGLKPPEAVWRATEEYLCEEDTIGRWIVERCIVGVNEKDTQAALYESYGQWCGTVGEQSGRLKEFSKSLEDRGYQKKRLTGGPQGFLGIHVLPNSVSRNSSDESEKSSD